MRIVAEKPNNKATSGPGAAKKAPAKKKKRGGGGDEMLIMRLRKRIPIIVWAFTGVFFFSLFYFFGGSFVEDFVNRGGPVVPKGKTKISKFVAVVDGHRIDRTLLNESYIRILEMGDFQNANRNYFMRMYIKSQALDRLIQQEILIQEAKKRKVSVTSGEVNKSIRSYRDFLVGTPEKLDNPSIQARVKFFFKDKDKNEEIRGALANRGTTWKTFKKMMAREALERKVFKVISDEAKAKEETQAKKRADDVLAKVKAGEAFYIIAAQFSEDEGSKATGGDRGWFTRGTYEKEFEDAAFGMNPGQTSELVKSDSGYHIIYLEGKKIASGPDYEAERPGLITMLTEKSGGKIPSEAEVKTAFEQVKARHILIKTKSPELIVSEWLQAERPKHKIDILDAEISAYRYLMQLDTSTAAKKTDYNKAVSMLDKARKTDPKNEYLYYLKGFMYETMYNEQKAEAGEKPKEADPYAVAIDEKATDGKNSKGKAADKGADLMKKALEQYQLAFNIAEERETYPSDPMLYVAVAKSHEELGHKEKARKFYATAVDFAAGNISFLRQIEEGLVRLGGQKKALTAARELILEMTPQAPAPEPPAEETTEDAAEGEQTGAAEETETPEEEAEAPVPESKPAPQKSAPAPVPAAR